MCSGKLCHIRVWVVSLERGKAWTMVADNEGQGQMLNQHGTLVPQDLVILLFKDDS